MKSVRRVLLERHHGAIPALDEVRTEIVSELAEQDQTPRRTEVSPTESWLGTLWQEWFVSCRRYWMGLGAAWCGILIFTWVESGERAVNGKMAGAASVPMTQAMQEQLQLRDELLGGVAVQEARAAHEAPILGPRSARRSEWVQV
jgi:hypothetical protein